eukprot:998467-Prorocentrum_minimum.AAC.1
MRPPAPCRSCRRAVDGKGCTVDGKGYTADGKGRTHLCLADHVDAQWTVRGAQRTVRDARTSALQIMSTCSGR